MQKGCIYTFTRADSTGYGLYLAERLVDIDNYLWDTDKFAVAKTKLKIG